IERDEEQREDVERQRKLDPRRADRRLARLVDGALVSRVAIAQEDGVEQVGRDEAAEHKGASTQEEDDGNQISASGHTRLLTNRPSRARSRPACAMNSCGAPSAIIARPIWPQQWAQAGCMPKEAARHDSPNDSCAALPPPNVSQAGV